MSWSTLAWSQRAWGALGIAPTGGGGIEAIEEADAELLSAFNFSNPFDHVLPLPTATLGEADRQHLWGLFSGILAQEGDIIPDPFFFIDVVDAGLGELVTSNAITVTGITAPAPLSFVETGHSSGLFSINNGPFIDLATTTINELDTLELRLTASEFQNTTLSITATIGGVSDQWDVTSTILDAPILEDHILKFSSVSNIVKMVDTAVPLGFMLLEADGSVLQETGLELHLGGTDPEHHFLKFESASNIIKMIDAVPGLGFILLQSGGTLLQETGSEIEN